MAQAHHVEIVQQGTAAITAWRKYPDATYLDLTLAKLTGALLPGADLFRADLSMADLSEANLSRADLTLAKITGALLTGALLTEADLSWANLSWADLSRADLSRALLTGALLTGTDLTGAKLSEALLTGAKLTGAKLTAADLTGAKLTAANLSEANLSRARLSEADLSGAIMAFTMIGQVDLHLVIGLADVIHEGPSTIGVDTLLTSVRRAGGKLTPPLEAFFLGAGVPRELLNAVPGMVADVKYHTCFISYGQPDHALAMRLHSDLVARGVSCWLDALDATSGKRIQGEIGQKRRAADKMIVLCSSRSLIRDGVLQEIEDQIAEAPDKMLPVSVDDRWKEPGFRVLRGTRDLKPSLLDKNDADFTHADTYDGALARLLQGLARDQTVNPEASD